MNTAAMSPELAYEMFVGGITAQEFVAPFGGNVDSAINQLMAETWWEADDDGTPAPENLPELIREYVEKILDS